MRKLAEERSGRCLSKKYMGKYVKLTWECAFGHIFKTSHSDIINYDRWCYKCDGKMKKTIKDMHVLAKRYKGKCLSKEYKSSHTYLKWQCKKGHVFEMAPHNINPDTWCKHCQREKKLKKTISIGELCKTLRGWIHEAKYLTRHGYFKEAYAIYLEINEQQEGYKLRKMIFNNYIDKYKIIGIKKRMADIIIYRYKDESVLQCQDVAQMFNKTEAQIKYYENWALNKILKYIDKIRYQESGPIRSVIKHARNNIKNINSNEIKGNDEQ